MTDKLKKFFKNKKSDMKFKRAGPGYKLNESPSPSVNSQSDDDFQPVPTRSGLTQETKQAAAAALARLEGKKKDTSINRSFSAIQAQVRREMAAEKEREMAMRASQAAVDALKTKEVQLESPAALAVRGVYFKCPLLGPEVLSRDEWHQKIREFLYEQLPEEKGLTACLILHNLNKSREKVKDCVDVIIKYFENILENPTEEKYRKIRVSNRIYQEKVMPLEGASLVLEAAGFEIKKLPHLNGEEDFLVFPNDQVGEAHDTLEMLIDALKNAEPITLELDRNMQVLLPKQAKERSELPATFFNLTVEEIRREQQLRAEAVEKSQMLRTKAMRERDEIQEIRKYKFGVIRIRFPEEILLQGTFGVYEKLSAVFEFVRGALANESVHFSLTTPTGQKLCDENATLAELKLIPASVLNFRAESHRDPNESYLKPEVLTLMQTIYS